MSNSLRQQWGILGNERKFDPVDEWTNSKSVPAYERLKWDHNEYLIDMSWPKPVPAAAVIQVGQRSWSLMGFKRDKMG